jgi:hypothetical protein
MAKTPQLRRLEHRLHELFDGQIDMSDWDDGIEEQKESAFLSRGLAAYCIHYLTGADPSDAAGSVTDGRNDGGIDAIYIDHSSMIVYMAQSKWSHNSTKSIPKSDVAGLMDGITSVLFDEWDSFGPKVLSRRNELFAAIKDPRSLFVPILATTGNVALSPPAQKTLQTQVKRINKQGELISNVEIFNLSRLHDSLLSGTRQSSIDAEITLFGWGAVRSPYEAYYGQVDADTILKWKEHGSALFAKNLRLFLGSRSHVYSSVKHTLEKEPEHFWYFNNGITILCDSIAKQPIYAGNTEKGIFECKGISVVNGAQTIGSFWHSSTAGESLDPATKIAVRIISLANCPPEFAKSVTKAANTQNQIELKDFAALDPNQQRLATEMALSGKKYTYRSGDTIPRHVEGCDMAEAAIALACKTSLEYTSHAYKEVSVLWQDIGQQPYTALFNDKLTSERLWRTVQVYRAIEKALARADKREIPRGEMIATHGTRFLVYRTFQDPEMKQVDNQEIAVEQFCDLAELIAVHELHKVATHIHATEPSSYPQTVFKSVTRCKAIDDAVPRGGYPSTSVPPAGFLFKTT